MSLLPQELVVAIHGNRAPDTHRSAGTGINLVIPEDTQCSLHTHERALPQDRVHVYAKRVAAAYRQ